MPPFRAVLPLNDLAARDTFFKAEELVQALYAKVAEKQLAKLNALEVGEGVGEEQAGDDDEASKATPPRPKRQCPAAAPLPPLNNHNPIFR